MVPPRNRRPIRAPRGNADLADNPDARLKAELARELGNFTGAARLLEDDFPDEGHGHVADIIKRLSGRGIRVVQEITYPDQPG